MTTDSLPYPRPHLALVGRPNVGKSTLFNRLIGARKAVVFSERGTTRDRLYGRADWRGKTLTLIDTGGMELARTDGLAAAVQRHVAQALREADGFILVCDGKEGLVAADELILDRLRRADKPIALAVNKLDHRLALPPDFFSLELGRLGMGAPIPISALHGLGTGELLDRLVSRCIGSSNANAGSAASPSAEPATAVAIIGRQNVGKSSLLNALLAEERVIVSETPGTTRDAIDTALSIDGESLILIDTAGLRHKRKVKSSVDLFSMARTIEAISRCDLALLVLDGAQGIAQDDRRIIAKVCQMGRGLILLINKWDLVKQKGLRSQGSAAAPKLISPKEERKLTEALHRALPAAAFAPVLALSAKSGFQVDRTIGLILQVARAMKRGLSDHECRLLLQEAWASQAPPRLFGRAIRLAEARWLSARPPRVELSTSPIGRLPVPYQHYLLKRFYRHPRLMGVPVRLVIKGEGEGRAPRARKGPRRNSRRRR